MTNGEILKQKLGLEKIKYVRMQRIYPISKPTYIIYYDSLRPNVPMTLNKIKSAPFPTRVYYGMTGFEKYPKTTPPFPIEEFNGKLYNGIFIAIDLSGKLHIDDRIIDAKYENVTLADLKGNKGISNFTKRFRKERDTKPNNQKENIASKLISVEIDKEDNSVTFTFQSIPTLEPSYVKNPIGREIKITNPENGWALIPGSVYTQKIKILDFFGWLSTQPDKQEVTVADIKDIFKVSYIQVFSNDPSFHWQGLSYNLDQIGGAIYPQPIQPKKWNGVMLHNEEGFLNKHLSGIINQIGFWQNPMATMLNKALKQEGLL